jgi:SPP1 family predicted phage head-tail adaptor
MTNIANLRHRVQIQKYTETQDNQSGTVKTWTTLMTVFAEVKSVTGYVTFNSQQIEEKITHTIRIRWQSGITSENWLLMNSRRFRIRNVQNLFEKNRFLILMCEEVFYASTSFEVNDNSIGDPLVSSLPAEN